MMKTKVLCMLLVAVMTLSLAACGSTGKGDTTTAAGSTASDETSTSGSQTTAESTEGKVELEEKTIQIWVGGPGKQRDSEKVWKAFNEMLQEYVPNTTVEFTVMDGTEYKEKFAQMLAAGEKVDLAWVADWVTGTMADHIEDGNFMELDSLLEEYGSGIVDSLSEEIIDFHRADDGKVYYLISWQGLAGSKYGYWMPAEIADKTSATWIDDTRNLVHDWFYSAADVDKFNAVLDQFEAYLETAKANNMLGAGVKYKGGFMAWQNSYHGATVLAPLRYVGVQMFDDTFTAQDLIATEHFKVYAQRMADWYKKGYIKQDAASADLTGYDYPKAGEITNQTWILDSNQLWTDTELGDKNMSVNMGMPCYTIELEEKFTLTKGDGTAMAIPYCADEPERAMMVLDALYSVPELWQLWVYGIEGEHWTDNGDGTITRLGGEGVDDSYGQWNWALGNCINTLPTNVTQIDRYQRYKDAEANAIASPFAAFKFVKSSEINAIMSALSAIDSKYYSQISYGYHGDNWTKVYDEWMKERKAAGVDALVAEYQKQLDEYRTKNNITSWDAFR